VGYFMLFKERIRRSVESIFGGFHIRHDEQIKRLHGEYWIRVYDSKTKNLIEERHGCNVIVDSCSILIARLLKNNSEPTQGISYLAVGTGNPSWDVQNPPAPTTEQTSLVSELSRQTFDITNFIDPGSGDVVNYATNIVDYTATFSETQAVGAIDEMGLIGGDAGDIPDQSSDTLINYRTFPVINKSNSMIMAITFRITS
jgi:hypothetical protein